MVQGGHEGASPEHLYLKSLFLLLSLSTVYVLGFILGNMLFIVIHLFQWSFTVHSMADSTRVEREMGLAILTMWYSSTILSLFSCAGREEKVGPGFIKT